MFLIEKIFSQYVKILQFLFKFFKKDFILKKNKDVKFYLPVKFLHRPVLRKILLGKTYEEETLNFIKKECYKKNKKIDILHAGAFIGDFLPYLSEYISKNNLVYAYEPIRYHFEVSIININLNKLNNVKIYNQSLSDINEKKYYKTKNKNYELGGASKISNLKDYNEIGTSTTIDENIEEYQELGIIHLDIEGHENKALFGGMQTINKFKPILILETPLDKLIFNKLKKIGYTFSGKILDNYIYRA